MLPREGEALERGLLGALVADPITARAALGSAGLAPEHFHTPHGAALFEAMRKAPSIGNPMTLLLDEPELFDLAMTVLDHAPSKTEVEGWALALRSIRRPQTEEDLQAAQVEATLGTLAREQEAFLRWPWPRLQEAIGGLAPSDIAFLVGHSGGGKTTFLLSLVFRLITRGRKVYYAGLESRPAWLRTQLACRVLGLDPGPILSGDFLGQPNAEDIRARLRHEVNEQRTNPIYQRLRFASSEFLSAPTLDRITKSAAEWGADLLIIDHIDHVQPESTGDSYGESRAINLLLKQAADATGLRVLAASQTNLVGLSADAWRNHRPIRDEHVYMGSHKRHLASVMLGVYRPMLEKIPQEQRDAVKEGTADKSTCLQQGVVAVNVMKSRNYGGREGQVLRLGYDRGDVTDQPDPAVVRQQTLGVAPEAVSGRRGKRGLTLLDGEAIA